MLAILLLGLTWLGLFLALADPDGPARLSLREAALWAAVVWASLAVIAAWLLSIGAGHDPNAAAGGNFTRGGLLIVWGVAALFGAVLIWRSRGSIAGHRARLLGGHAELTRFERLLLWSSAGIVAAAALVGVISAPTTWDSMTYHLARVAIWEQLGGISHYATSAEPQLFHPPGAETLIAHLQVISGGDRFAASVQSVALALVLIAASMIARSLGGGRRAQLLAATLAATTPMALLQASSTQNDLLVGCWLLICGALALVLLDAGGSGDSARVQLARAAVAAIAVALAIATKGSAWVYLPPLLIVLAVAIVRALGWGGFAKVSVVGVLALGVLTGPAMLQNHQTFGSYVFTGSESFSYSNTAHTPGAILSNVTRNVAIHFGTPVLAINERLTQRVSSGLEALGQNPSDPATTFPGITFEVPRAGPEEGHAPSLLLLILGLGALGMTFFVSGFRSGRRLAWAGVVLSGVIVFALLLKWQPFHSRLHLPGQLLAVPLIAVALDQAFAGRRLNRVLVAASTAIALALAAILLLFNVDRPLIGVDGRASILTNPRSEQYFAAWPQLAAPYGAVIDRIATAGHERVVLVGGFDDWYYPFSALLPAGTRISYNLVPNASARYPQLPGSEIDALVCLSCGPETRQRLTQLGLSLVPGLQFQVPADEARGGAGVELWERAGAQRGGAQQAVPGR